MEDSTSMEDKIVAVLNEMAEYLSVSQMKKLQEVMLGACFPDSVVGFMANERTSNIFIHYWFSFFQAILESQAPESAQKNINLKILSELKVINPSKEAQVEFEEFVKQVDKSKVVA